LKRGSAESKRAGGESGAAARSGARAYFERSRRLSVSFLAITPLLALYEVGLAVTDAPIANGAELLLRRIFYVAGPRYGPMLWRIALLAAFAGAAFVVIRDSVPVLRDVPRIALEGLAYGAFLGPFALWLQRRLVSFLAIQAGERHGIVLDAALACGAGVYEEILFRLLVLSAIYYVVRRATGTGAAHQVAAGIVAVVASSLLFSAFHHWPGGEPFEWRPFVFRSIAGSTLGALFLARGLGIAVYTHAAYDLLVTFWH
jgi:hypothetical protein